MRGDENSHSEEKATSRDEKRLDPLVIQKTAHGYLISKTGAVETGEPLARKLTKAFVKKRQGIAIVRGSIRFEVRPEFKYMQPAGMKGPAASYSPPKVDVQIARKDLDRVLSGVRGRTAVRKSDVMDDIIRNVGTSETFSFDSSYQRLTAASGELAASLEKIRARKAAAKAAAPISAAPAKR